MLSSAYGWGPIPMMNAYDIATGLPVLPWSEKEFQTLHPEIEHHSAYSAPALVVCRHSIDTKLVETRLRLNAAAAR